VKKSAKNMINKFRQLYTEWMIKRVLHRGFSPSADEIHKAHAAFMTEFERQFPFTEQVKTSYFYHYALAAIAGIFILNGGAVIYADTVDVSTNHPLYSYKRVAEEVKVRTATASKKPEVEIQIAQRRIKEIKHINAQAAITASTTRATASKTEHSTTSSKTSSKAQIKLKQNFKKHIEAIETEVEDGQVSKKDNAKRDILCKKLKSVQVDVVALFEQEDKDEMQQRITKLCTNEIEPHEQLRNSESKKDSSEYTTTKLKTESKNEGGSKLKLKGTAVRNLFEQEDD
jgi:hypothetical protein